jgi:hypothetical protein
MDTEFTMKTHSLILVIFLFLVGCNNSPEPTKTLATTIQTRVVPTIIPTLLKSAVTPTLVPTTIKTPIVHEPSYTKQCVDITASKLSDLSGTLLIHSPIITSKPLLINLKTGEKKSFLNKNDDGAADFTLSPDGEWLAYIHWGLQTKDELVVESVNGEQVFSTPMGLKDWNGIVTKSYWLNNEDLVLWRHSSSSLDNVIILNPLTKKRTEMSTYYPDIISDDWSWRMSWPSITIYSPSLDHLVYLSNKEGEIMAGFQKLVLWDLKNSKRITEVTGFGFTEEKPIWKSDGSGVFFVKANEGYHPALNKDELFFLGVNGSLKQLTNLSNAFHNAIIFSYSLSPDEKYLAFAIRADDLEATVRENRLLILNTATLEVSDTCLIQEWFSGMVWSPDSRKIAYSEPVGKRNSRTVLFDIFDRKANIFAEDSVPEVWFRSYEK